MTEELMERIAEKLLLNIEQRLDQAGLLEVKDYKAVTGALKELKEFVHTGDEPGDSGFVVRFEGEAEQWAG